MIQTRVTPPPPPLQFKGNAAQVTWPCPNPPPPPPVGDIDFSTIDTPEKAALVPVLNAPLTSTLVAGVVGSLLGGGTVGASVNMVLGNRTPVSLEYMGDPSGQSLLYGQGTVGGLPFQEWWVPAPEGGVHIVGHIGQVEHHLTLQNLTTGFLLRGMIGSVTVSQSIFNVGLLSTMRYVADGKMNDTVKFHTEVYPPLAGETQTEAVRGYLGNANTLLDTQVECSEDSKQLTLTSSGLIAGQLVRVGARVTNN